MGSLSELDVMSGVQSMLRRVEIRSTHRVAVRVAQDQVDLPLRIAKRAYGKVGDLCVVAAVGCPVEHHFGRPGHLDERTIVIGCHERSRRVGIRYGLQCAAGGKARKREKNEFAHASEFQPAGDQPTAIAELSQGIREGERDQVLLGATGTGKTFTMAKVIEETQRPAIILAPNKTLAAQLYGEFKGFFPDNAVEYFVSYYDYYQPEAYVPRSDTYIEKESRSTSRSTGCATRPPGRCWNATT
jgi:hypothetical protein